MARDHVVVGISDRYSSFSQDDEDLSRLVTVSLKVIGLFI